MLIANFRRTVEGGLAGYGGGIIPDGIAFGFDEVFPFAAHDSGIPLSMLEYFEPVAVYDRTESV